MPRRKKLSSNTQATFKWNWDHCENGTAHPVESEGCTTYIGPPLSEKAGKNSDGLIYVFVAECIRKCGWSVTIIPEGTESINAVESVNNSSHDDAQEGSRKRQKIEDKTLREQELAYLDKEYNRAEIEVYDEKKKLIASFTTIGMDNTWLCLTCMNEVVSTRLCEELDEDFDLATFPHVREHVEITTDCIGGSYRLEAVTGDTRGSINKCSINTLFKLYFTDDASSNEKLVAKALYSYENAEMGTVGPTLEMIETAREWQRNGLGDALLEAIEEFYLERFGHFQSEIWYSVCYVVNADAGRWLMKRHGFRDLDGMGEELGKVLC
jgi:GNAT superfamily N-acetyltransferase